ISTCAAQGASAPGPLQVSGRWPPRRGSRRWYDRVGCRRSGPASPPARSETFVTLPDDSYTQLAPDLRLCRVLNGMWQGSGAPGAIDRRAAIPSMVAYHDAGFTTWDLADHYGPAEDFVGVFRRALAVDRGEAALDQVQAFTKWVPPPERVTRQS